MRNAYTRPFFSYHGTPSLPQSPRYKECNLPVSSSARSTRQNSSGMLSYFCLYYSTDQSLSSLREIGACLNRASDAERPRSRRLTPNRITVTGSANEIALTELIEHTCQSAARMRGCRTGWSSDSSSNKVDLSRKAYSLSNNWNLLWP